VVAVVEDRSGAVPQAIEPARDARREADHRARERALIARLGDGVNVA